MCGQDLKLYATYTTALKPAAAAAAAVVVVVVVGLMLQIHLYTATA